MKLSRRDVLRLSFAILLESSIKSIAQTPAPQFDVASVKPSGNPDGPQKINWTPRRVQADSVTLSRCIREAYDVAPNLLIGGPNWLDRDRWAISARAESAVNDAVLKQMMQALLADRFMLLVHQETRSLPVYVLEAGHKGSNMRKVQPGDDEFELIGGHGGPTTLKARKMDMDKLAQVLGWRMDRQVVNRTGLDGEFEFSLHWLADTVRNSEAGDDVSIFTAISEQLGLSLRPEKIPLAVLVVDRAERPSAD